LANFGGGEKGERENEEACFFFPPRNKEERAKRKR
jgi:hypothetical protein